MKQLLWVTSALLFIGCANTDKIEPKTATIDFYFAPDSGMQTTFTNGEDVIWNIDYAAMLPGEIGIHWSRIVASRSESKAFDTYSPIAPRHDISGKISPKIYGYFAVDLLDTVHVQQLAIDPDKEYDHIHMIMIPATAVTTADSVRDLGDHPQLTDNSMVISGTVSNGFITKPFIFKNSNVYGENDLGDILIHFQPAADTEYRVVIHPDFAKWFNNVNWENLEGTDTVHINSNSNNLAFESIEDALTFDNAMKCDIKKK